MLIKLPEKNNKEKSWPKDIWFAWFPVITKNREIVWFENVLREQVRKYVCADHGWIENGFKYKYERWLPK